MGYIQGTAKFLFNFHSSFSSLSSGDVRKKRTKDKAARTVADRRTKPGDWLPITCLLVARKARWGHSPASNDKSK